jgi:predicted solute-binding protein
VQFKLRNVDLSKKDLLAKKEESQDDDKKSVDGKDSKSTSETAPGVVKKGDTTIKDGITDEEFLASRIRIDSGENKGSYAQIIDDGRVFKRVKNGPPVFAGTDYTYKRARNEEEIKKIMASV